MKHIHVLSATSDFRPVNQWNKAKQEEKKERKEYTPKEIMDVLDRKVKL